MKKYLYAQCNTISGEFNDIFTDSVLPTEIFEKLRSMYFYVKKDNLEFISECDLYLIGIYDTKTAEIDYSKEFIAHMSDITNEILVKKYGENNGKQD